jgi:multiple sugar transport system permease protein
MQAAQTRPAFQQTHIPIIWYFSQKNRGWLLLGYGILTIISLWTLLPVYWMLVTSIKPDSTTYEVQTSIVPSTVTLQHYVTMLFKSDFPTFFRNSFIVGASATILATLIGCMAGYSLIRLRFAGRVAVARLLIYSYLAPGSVLFIPLFMMMVQFRLTNSLQGLTLAYLTFTVPFATWMLMGYLRSIPMELEEAALVDGATRWTALWRIVLPLAAPAIVVVAVFSFTLSWNEFLYALVLNQKQTVLTALVGLARIIHDGPGSGRGWARALGLDGCWLGAGGCDRRTHRCVRRS